MKELWIKIFITSGTKVYTLVTGLVMLMITARWLGAEGRGIIAAITSWVMLFSVIGHLSLGQVAIHHSMEKDKKAWLGEILGSMLAISIMVSVISWIIIYFLYHTEGQASLLFINIPKEVLVLGFVALPLFIWEQYGPSLMMATDNLMVSNKLQIACRTISIIALIGGVVGLGWGVFGAVLAIILGQLFWVTGAIIFLWKYSSQQVRVKRKVLRELLGGGVKLHINSIGGFVIISSDILMINYFMGNEATGYYQLASQLVIAMTIIASGAGMVLFSKVAEIGVDNAWKFNKKVLQYILLFIVFIIGVSWWIAPWFLVAFAGADFASSVEIFRWLLLSLLGQSASLVMAPQWIGRGLFVHASIFTFGNVVLNLILNWYLIPLYGVMGAVIASVAVNVIMLIVNLAVAVWVDRTLTRTLR